KAYLEHALLNEYRHGYDPAAALRTSHAIPPLQLFEPRQKAIVIGAMEQAVEFTDPTKSPDEDLNSARVADQIRLRFLRFTNFPRLGAHRAGKQPLFAIERHWESIATWKYARCPLSLYIVGPVF